MALTHSKIYDDHNTYVLDVSSDGFIETKPHISFCQDDKHVHYDKKQKFRIYSNSSLYPQDPSKTFNVDPIDLDSFTIDENQPLTIYTGIYEDNINFIKFNINGVSYIRNLDEVCERIVIPFNKTSNVMKINFYKVFGDIEISFIIPII